MRAVIVAPWRACGVNTRTQTHTEQLKHNSPCWSPEKCYRETKRIENNRLQKTVDCRPSWLNLHTRWGR